MLFVKFQVQMFIERQIFNHSNNVIFQNGIQDSIERSYDTNSYKILACDF